MKAKVIIKRLRQKVGLTQQEMANKCGISRGYIAIIESSDQDINLQTFLKLCKSVGYTDYNLLLTEEETEN